MTVGIGLLPSQEPGCVVVTDSLMHSPGRGPCEITDEKLLGLANPAAALVVSGHTNLDEMTAMGLSFGRQAVAACMDRGQRYPAHIARSAVEALYRQIEAMDARVWARRDPIDDADRDEQRLRRDPSPHVILATAPTDGPPQLARLSPIGHIWAKPGRAFVIGCVLLGPDDALAEFNRPAPATLAECRAWAVEWVGRFIDRCWGTRDALRMIRETGVAPCIGFPLQVLTLTASDFALEEIN